MDATFTFAGQFGGRLLELDLVTTYLQDEQAGISLVVRMVPALAFLPTDDVPVAFDALFDDVQELLEEVF